MKNYSGFIIHDEFKFRHEIKVKEQHNLLKRKPARPNNSDLSQYTSAF